MSELRVYKSELRVYISELRVYKSELRVYMSELCDKMSQSPCFIFYSVAEIGFHTMSVIKTNLNAFTRQE